MFIHRSNLFFFNTVNTYIQEQNKNCDIHTLKLH